MKTEYTQHISASYHAENYNGGPHVRTFRSATFRQSVDTRNFSSVLSTCNASLRTVEITRFLRFVHGLIF